MGNCRTRGGGGWEARSGRYKAVNGRWETAGRGGVGGGRFVLAGTKRLMAVGKPPQDGDGGGWEARSGRYKAVNGRGKPPDEGGWGVGGSFWPVQSG